MTPDLNYERAGAGEISAKITHGMYKQICYIVRKELARGGAVGRLGGTRNVPLTLD